MIVFVITIRYMNLCKWLWEWRFGLVTLRTINRASSTFLILLWCILTLFYPDRYLLQRFLAKSSWNVAFLFKTVINESYKHYLTMLYVYMCGCFTHILLAFFLIKVCPSKLNTKTAKTTHIVYTYFCMHDASE